MKIQELIIYTSNLEEQVDFYTTVLEFPLIKKTASTCSFEIGESILTFEYQKTSKAYHFAFNIPSNKIEEAYQWLKTRLDLLPFENKEIIDFAYWNAKALYFYDKDNNIVEFISRKDLNSNSEVIFSSKSVLNISEIAIATSNIENIFKELHKLRAIEIYDGSFKRFCALGNEDGLFILVNKDLKKWFPTDDVIFESNFIAKGDYNFEYRDGKIIELVNFDF